MLKVEIEYKKYKLIKYSRSIFGMKERDYAEHEVIWGDLADDFPEVIKEYDFLEDAMKALSNYNNIIYKSGRILNVTEYAIEAINYTYDVNNNLIETSYDYYFND